MTDESTQRLPSKEPEVGRQPELNEEPGAPTPEELLAETQADDPEVGSDGIGMGELP